MKFKRWSCHCRLCGRRWMSGTVDFAAAFAEHVPSCPKAAEVLLARTNRFKTSIAAETYQVAAVYLDRSQLVGRISRGVRCDARCMGAVGPSCDCSCGGKNHGVGLVAEGQSALFS